MQKKLGEGGEGRGQNVEKGGDPRLQMQSN